jgi:CO/xanthine dehydrogenase Mo-binding subunit
VRLVDYAHDAAAEGMWHAAFVRSPHPHARVLSVDASALSAEAIALLPADTAGLGR